jgi:hypothetical protein
MLIALCSHTESAASIISAPFISIPLSLRFFNSRLWVFAFTFIYKPLPHVPRISVSLFPVHDHSTTFSYCTTQCPPSPHPCPAPHRSTVIPHRCSSCRLSHILSRWCATTAVALRRLLTRDFAGYIRVTTRHEHPNTHVSHKPCRFTPRSLFICELHVA